jgi:hypothetical protein
MVSQKLENACFRHSGEPPDLVRGRLLNQGFSATYKHLDPVFQRDEGFSQMHQLLTRI